MNKKGFTLIEILAVIVVLAILLVIAIPSISSIIGQSKIQSFVIDTKSVIKAVEVKRTANRHYDITKINRANIKKELDISPDNYASIIINETETTPYVTIVGSKQWKGLVACGTADNLMVGDGTGCLKFASDEMYFTFDEITRTITDYNGPSDVVIPVTIRDIPVEHLGLRSF